MIGPTGMLPGPHFSFTVNPDGTINLCDEILYGVSGKLYATFDSFTFNPVTGTVASVVGQNVDPAVEQRDLLKKICYWA